MKRSQVYFNLHKRCFSVQQGGKVYAHADGVMLENVRFNVAKAGQRKVRETGRKNVHARVSGYSFEAMEPIIPHWATAENGWNRASYNPYKNDTFIDFVTGEAIHDASRVLMFAFEGATPLILYKRTLAD